MKMKVKIIILITILIHLVFINFSNLFPDGQRGMWELNIEDAPELYKDAVSATIKELLKTNEKPEEFYVQFPEKPTNEPVIVLNLWHKSAFDKINYGKEGNPGGKCRDMYYDKQEHKIIKVLFWQ